MIRNSLRIHKYIQGTEVEGPGKRFGLWVQGCSIHCRGCAEKRLWDFNSGYDMDVKQLFEIIKKDASIEGITVLGGEPFEQATPLGILLEMCQKANLNVITFTGFELELLLAKRDAAIDKVLMNTDLLIDGAFKQELLDYSRPWVGSINQRYLFLSDRFKKLQDDFRNYQNRMEIRIDKNGVVQANGMWKKSTISKIMEV